MKKQLWLLLIALLLFSACGPAAAPAPSAVEPAAAEPAATEPPATEPAATEPAQAEAPVAEAAVSPADQGACTTEAAAGTLPEGKLRLVIGTGGTGGVFFPYGGGLARIITEKMENAEATAEVTGGSVDNMKLIIDGDADLGLSTLDSAFDAINGMGAYEDTGAIPACALAVLYKSFVHVVSLDSSGITTLADLKDKRISVGSAGSSTEAIADRILEAVGIDPQAEITRDNLSVAESVAAMKDQKIDAFFWIGGLPTGAVTDLVSTPNMEITFLPTDAVVDALREKYGPVYTAYTLPKDIYGLDADVPGLGIGNVLFVNANMPEELAHQLLKTIFDNLDEIKTIHPEAESLSMETAVVDSSIPFHPGAIRFYQEAGVWQ